MIKSVDDLLDRVKKRKKNKIVVVAPEDKSTVKVIEEAAKMDLAEFILIGDKDKINLKGKTFSSYEVIEEPDHKRASEEAVKLIKNKEAEAMMKGSLHTGTFLKAILNKETGINHRDLVSQVSVYDKEYGEGLQLLTDCAMAIEPSLTEKKQIIENAVELALKLGYKKPKVAILSALEVINPEIKDTEEAAILSKMGDRGQIKNAIIDGPFALDNAISPRAADLKNIKGEVAGAADILVVPNLQVGNVLTKSLTFFAKKKVAAAVMGIDIPLVMTSRTEAEAGKVLSIALASYIS